MRGARHVAVGSRHRYAIDLNHRALRWEEGSSQPELMLDEVAYLAAGDSSVMAIRCDGTVLGTGGNRFGPLGNHGYGDKAPRWGAILRIV